VAPCYNEALGLAEFHRRVSATCRKTVDTDYEIILVNDGSQDGTWAVMSELSASDAHVLAINLARNYGHQIALTAGLHYTRGKRILIIDADLQDPPELLDEMMHRMDEGADVVYGKREFRQGKSGSSERPRACFTVCSSDWSRSKFLEIRETFGCSPGERSRY
jgi:polyisoprenyl-phosphate glycosyltransferase